ncbi:MAG: AAA family ATPase [Chloroflexi bacterium]|nr:AAA family ATPase [Chloroflexota bacterium]
MLTRLAIKNFKSIGDPGVDLELKPLTFLVGPNGSGKSSVLEALAFFVQSARGDLSRHQYFPFVNQADLFYVEGDHRAEAIEIGLGEGEPILWLKYDSTRPEYPDPSARAETQNSQIARLIRQPELVFRPISAYRGVIGDRLGLLTGWVGLRGEHLVEVEFKLAENQNRYEEAKEWGNKFEISDAHSQWLGGDNIRSEFKEPVLRSTLPKSSASFGSRQAWTIVVQLLASELGELVTIEEPEISLHPQAQVDMAELLATAASEGKQILATTHSTFLLLGLGEAVRNRIISTRDIAIYEVVKGPKGTAATRLPITDKGYIKGGVPSFAKVEKRLMREFLKSLPKE